MILMSMAGCYMLGSMNGYRNGTVDGKIDAYYDMSMTGRMVYFNCLLEHCTAQRTDSEYIVGKAHDHLRELGVKIDY
jgi:hypothetical protein